MTRLGDSPIVLAAGGTGGHMFPAQALAIELRARGRLVTLITDMRGAGYAGGFGQIGVHVVAARNLPAGVAAKAGAAFELGLGAFQSLRLLRQLAPAVVAGFGGYPSLPAMAAAIWLGVPTCIHEQNAVLGRVNRLLAHRASFIAASVAGMQGMRAIDQAKVTVTGNPVRAGIAAWHGRAYQAPEEDGQFNLLVFGGSQGATVLSEAVPDAIAMLPLAARARLNILQQCRAGDLARVRHTYARAGVAAELVEFIRDMPERLGTAHLVIARSGATTVSELSVASVPSILIPYPHHRDQQQLANARALAGAGAAWLMQESELTAAELAKRLQQLLRRPALLSVAAAAAGGLGRPDAAKALADMVERIAPRKSNGPAGGGDKVLSFLGVRGVAA